MTGTFDYHARVRKQQQTAGTIAGCFGCGGLLIWLAFWFLVIAALIKLVFFGGFD